MELKLSGISSEFYFLEQTTLELQIRDDTTTLSTKDKLELQVNVLETAFNSVTLELDKNLGANPDFDGDLYFYIKAQSADLLNLQDLRYFFINRDFEPKFTLAGQSFYTMAPVSSILLLEGSMLSFSLPGVYLTYIPFKYSASLDLIASLFRCFHVSFSILLDNNE